MFHIVIPYNFSMDDQSFSKWAWMRSCSKFKFQSSEASLYVGIMSQLLTEVKLYFCVFLCQIQNKMTSFENE